ncbi:MAG TPA: response regulator [Bryobacteraceae bacterium]|nr:response regulator [Bryobacteraceae bacterium]
MKILVADDNADAREVLSDFLRAWGFDVTEASTGREAVILASEWFPDLVLMDLCMPVMDGFAALREIREHSQITQVPVIAITACAIHDVKQKVLSAGFNGYFSKPLEFAALRTHICHLLTTNAGQ